MHHKKIILNFFQTIFEYFFSVKNLEQEHNDFTFNEEASAKVNLFRNLIRRRRRQEVYKQKS